jgi:uncharacterized RmlC-like cupin family protein
MAYCGAMTLRHIPADSLSDATGQTSGMRRLAAISSSTAGSQSIFMGQTHVLPATSSGPHHHAESETCIYVVSGRPRFRFKEEDREQVLDTAPGDYVYVPPFEPHIEENPHGEEAVVVLARSTQEAIVVNLDRL